MESDHRPEPSLLEQAQDRALRLHERVVADETDLLTHASKAKSFGFIEPSPDTLGDGAAMLHGVVDSLEALTEIIAVALKAEESARGKRAP